MIFRTTWLPHSAPDISVLTLVRLCACGANSLLRHFNVLYHDEFASEVIKKIFTPILRGAWEQTLPALCHCAAETIEATVGAYERIKAHLLPTPLKCHYSFTVREISRALEVMLMADISKLTGKLDIARYGLQNVG